MQQSRRSLATQHILNVMFPSHLQRINHQTLFQSGSLVDFLQYPVVYLLPEPRDTAHGSRPYFLDCLLNILRTQIDAQQAPLADAVIRPRSLKNMRKRKEVHHHFRIIKSRHPAVMRFKSRFKARMMQHHPLRFSGRTRSIKNIRQVIPGRRLRPGIHLLLQFCRLTQLQEIRIINRIGIGRCLLHLRIKDDNLFQRLAQILHPVCHIILVLLADKQKTDRSILQNIMHLCLRAGRIQRNRNDTTGKSAKIRIKTFRHVLRKHSHILLYSYTQSDQCFRRLSCFPRKLIPCHGHPHACLVITVF